MANCLFFLVQISARICRPSFRKNKHKKLVFNVWKRAFWAYFRKSWVFKFEHWSLEILTLDFRKCAFGTSKEVTSFTEYGHDPLECLPVIKYDFFWVTSFSRVTFCTKHEFFLEGLLSWNTIFLCDIFGGLWSSRALCLREMIPRGALISIEKRFLCGKWFPAEPWSL